MNFINALRQPISLPAWFYPAKQEASSTQSVAAPSRKLSRVLQGQGRLGYRVAKVSVHDYESWMRDDPNEFKLFVEEIGATQIHFHTPRDLQVGQPFQLELLLPGLGPCKASAVVDWTLASLSGFRAQATLSAEPNDAHKLRIYSELDWERGR